MRLKYVVKEVRRAAEKAGVLYQLLGIVVVLVHFVPRPVRSSSTRMRMLHESEAALGRIGAPLCLLDEDAPAVPFFDLSSVQRT